MKRVWIIANPASGSVSPAARRRVLAAFANFAEVIGETDFPAASMPTAAELDAAGVDTLAVLAGDGTINAAACRYSEWGGALLILPGGTMNLLARALHGDAAAEVIVAAAARARRIALPIAATDGHCGFVGVILGPATTWNLARERLRAGRLHGLWRAVRHAWSRTRASRIRLEGVPGRAQAVFIRAEEEALAVDAVEAADLGQIVALGWDWLTGDWVAARAVTSVRRTRLRVLGRRPVQALFDGEPALLPPGTEIRLERSPPIFLSTCEAAG